MLEGLQHLFRAYPEGLTLPQIVERYRMAVSTSHDRATGEATAYRYVEPEPRHKRPKHIRVYLEAAVDFGMMRVEASPEGFRYRALDSFFCLLEAGEPLPWGDEGKRLQEERSHELRLVLRAIGSTGFFEVVPGEPSTEEERSGKCFWFTREAAACKAELRARHTAYRLAQEEHYRQEHLRWKQEWTREMELKEKAFANPGRIVDGRLHCPHCQKEGLHLSTGWLCLACHRSFDSPKRLVLCTCGRHQSIPEGQKHAECQCGSFVWPP